MKGVGGKLHSFGAKEVRRIELFCENKGRRIEI